MVKPYYLPVSLFAFMSMPTFSCEYFSYNNEIDKPVSKLSVNSQQVKHDSCSDQLTQTTIDQKFLKVGSAKFSVLFWDIYDSALYSKSGKYQYQKSTETAVFKITYLKDISSNDLIDRTIQQWQSLNINEENYVKFIPQLKNIWPNIKASDSLALLINKHYSTFYYNDVKVGTINNSEFSDLFLAIWLSPNTSQLELKQQLLGLKVEGNK